MSQKKLATIALGTRISPQLYERMFEMARERDWTLSQFIRNALEHYVLTQNKNHHKKKVA